MKKLTAESIASDRGLNAAHRGESRESNPYPAKYSLHKWWDLGWLECHPDDFGTEKEED
jgi:ribosome modulation factor